jgi:hypothetical protein
MDREDELGEVGVEIAVGAEDRHCTR